MDDLPGQREIERLVHALPLDGQAEPRARRPAHLVDRVVQAEALDRLAVDGGDQVAGHHARLRRGRAIDRAHHLQQPAVVGHFQADAAELALRSRSACPSIACSVHVGAVRVEARQHAVQRVVDQRAGRLPARRNRRGRARTRCRTASAVHRSAPGRKAAPPPVARRTLARACWLRARRQNRPGNLHRPASRRRFV